jgi:hypothetical protein
MGKGCPGLANAKPWEEAVGARLLPDCKFNEIQHWLGMGWTAEPRICSIRHDNPSVTARHQRQTHVHRQSVGRSVFRLDGPAHGLDIAACDR